MCIRDSNHTESISQFVKRLSPANAEVSDTSQWQIIPVNSISGEASGNSSFRDGDTGWAEVPVSNSGEVDFNGSIGFAVDEGPYLFQNLTISPQSSTSVNFTIPQLFESNLTTLKPGLRPGPVTPRLCEIRRKSNGWFILVVNGTERIARGAIFSPDGLL